MTTSTAPVRVLVAFASKNGATAEIAAAVARQLGRDGLAVELAEASAVRSLDGFDAVVLGSAVYMKRWQGSARRLLRRLEHELGDRPLWIFSSGPVGDAKTDLSWCEPAGVLRRAAQLDLRDHVIFGGRVPAHPSNFVERAMARDTPAEKADLRDWSEIARWASTVAAELSSVPAEA